MLTYNSSEVFKGRE